MIVIGTRLVLMLLVTIAAHGQVAQRWEVAQPSYEAGWAWPDLDGDGVQELIKDDGIYSVFYDGANGYEAVWTVADPNPDDNTSFYLWLGGEGHHVFLHQNTTTQQARLHVYRTFEEEAQWSTALLEGNVSHGAIGDLDDDGIPELAWSWHQSSGDTWSSGWEVRTLSSGASRHYQAPAPGYLLGPWFANVEDTAGQELLFNWYGSDGSSLLSCWGSVQTAVDADINRPSAMELRVWPNPFNPACRIELSQVPSGVGELRIVALDGRVVRRMALNHGTRVMIWDGLNQEGRPAASGSYLMEAGPLSQRVTLLR